VQIAYAIGVAKPVSVMIDAFGTAKVSEEKISSAISELVDLRPAAIIKKFDLRRPIYKNFAAYGHMGREDLDAPWEKTDLAEKLSLLK
jgi:S-adenosylmethionine synthetase